MNLSTAWESLCRTLEIALEYKTELCMDEEDDAYLTIERIERAMTGCGCCDLDYPVLYIKGRIRTNYLEKPSHPYQGRIYLDLCRKRPVDLLNFFDPRIEAWVTETDKEIFFRWIRDSPFLQHISLPEEIFPASEDESEEDEKSEEESDNEPENE